LCAEFAGEDKDKFERMINMVYYILDADLDDKERSRISKKILSALVSKTKMDLAMSVNDLINEHKVDFDFDDPPTDNDSNYTMYAQIKSHDGQNDFELPLTMRSGGIFGIIAPPATGKTNIVLNIATSFAANDSEYSGIRFSEVAQARKMVVADFENDKEFSLRKYTHTIEKYLMSTAGETSCINKVNFVSLGSSENKKEDFFKIIRSGMYSIAIIDSLSMLVNSVNDEQENRQFMAELKRICIANDMSVIITSHTNKSNTTSGAGWSAQVLDQSCDTLGILTTIKNDQDKSVVQLDMDDKIIPANSKTNEKKMSKARHRGAGHFNLIMQWAWKDIGILERWIEEPNEEEVDIPDEVLRVLREFFDNNKVERKQSLNAIHKLLKDKCKVTYIGTMQSKSFLEMFNDIGKLSSYSIKYEKKGNMSYKFLQYDGMRTITAEELLDVKKIF
jgi:KaiC/GvpD/RAD55 family RecA-like ATPase